MIPSFEQAVSSGHRDASFHIGGHGEPWPDTKAIVVTHRTHGTDTYVCVRRDGVETVTPVDSVRQGLEMFAAELEAAIAVLPAE